MREVRVLERRELIVIGGGEHGRVVMEAARTRPDLWTLLGFTDRQPCEETVRRLGVPNLGDEQEALARYPESWWVLGIGGDGPAPRRGEIVRRLPAAEGRWATVVHERAWVSPTAVLKPGVVVLAGAVVNTGALVGEHCIVNTGAIVEHDVRLGAFTLLGPGGTVGGGTEVGEESFLGLGCKIRDHVRIGARVLVAMGAVVTRSVPDGMRVAGVPAREMPVRRSDV